MKILKYSPDPAKKARQKAQAILYNSKSITQATIVMSIK